MILNGSQRGCGLKLAAHLTNELDNDHVELHELKGFVSQTLRGALQEADAIAKGTRCKQFLFSLSLNPPQTERVGIADFEAAIARAEKRLDLSGQPRAIVFHEKNGRRHAHAVWSRIDVHKMKAINLPFYHNRLTDLSKDLFLEHGWRLPNGLRDRSNRDPRNFDLAEWQQAKRAGKDAREVKRVFQEAWQISDTSAAFAHALEEKGYFLARGDRRSYVALDVEGEVYAVPKWAGVKTKNVREKLGNSSRYRSVAETRAHISVTMQQAWKRWDTELTEARRKEKERQEQERRVLVERQRRERATLKSKHAERRQAELRHRQSRFRSGLKGLWDRLRGEHKRVQQENERAAWQSHLRDQRALDEMIFGQLEERRMLKARLDRDHSVYALRREELDQDRTRFNDSRSYNGDPRSAVAEPQR